MDTSPLVRLPAEIRDYIYTLVLGGNDIHVGSADNVMSYSVCTEASSHREMTSWFKNRELGEADFPSWFDHVHCATHGSGRQPAPIRLDLRLLLVCQEIYREAEALPFTTNTFILHSPLDLQYFANSLKEKQRTAVATVGLVTSFITGGQHFGAGPGVFRLSGLHHLVIVLGVPTKTTPDHVAALLEEAEEISGRRSLFSVDVLIRLRAHNRSSACDLARSAQQYATLARETELALLKPAVNQYTGQEARQTMSGIHHHHVLARSR